uniref:Phage portal protein n=1 Tax=Schlesneria paludicola TaxID=360056 RepID=A0A7C4LLG5_9PLAN
MSAARRFQMEYDRIPATSVLHWFRCDRPGQARGVPDILPALPRYAEVGRVKRVITPYREAVL